MGLDNLIPFKKKSENVEKPSHRHKVSIGLDIGRAHINVVQILKMSDSAILEKYAHHQIIPNTPISTQLKHLFQTAQINEKTVRVSIKGQGVILRFISFPKMSREEFESAIQYEAEKYLPFAMSEVVLDFYIVPPVKGKEAQKTMDVILVAARRQEIAKLVKTIQEANLQPDSIDVDAIAFTNAFLFSRKDAAESVCVLIDFGAKDVNIDIMDYGSLRFSRDITFGGYDITQFLKRKLQINDQEAIAIQTAPDTNNSPHVEALIQSFAVLIQEIKLSMNYFYGQHPDVQKPSAIFVSGGLARLDILRKTIETETGIPVMQWNPLESFTIGPEIKKGELEGFQSYLPVCLGLALR